MSSQFCEESSSVRAFAHGKDTEKKHASAMGSKNIRFTQTRILLQSCLRVNKKQGYTQTHKRFEHF